MKDTNLIVPFDSPHAAERTTVNGWKSRHGRFFADGPQAENLARYDGCTHTLCRECGVLVDKPYTLCLVHRGVKEKERYAKCEKKTWDGETPLVIFGDDRYFFGTEELLDYCLDNDVSPDSLMLVICEPNYAHGISSEIWSDILPEDFDLPVELKNAIDDFNNAIDVYKKPLSWDGGKYAAIVPEEIVEEYKKLKEEAEA